MRGPCCFTVFSLLALSLALGPARPAAAQSIPTEPSHTALLARPVEGPLPASAPRFTVPSLADLKGDLLMFTQRLRSRSWSAGRSFGAGEQPALAPRKLKAR